MSVKALSAVFEESRATDSAFVVLLALADWADHTGRCYPSYTQVAKKARVSRATAVTAIQRLIEIGELTREPHGQEPTPEDDDAPTKVRAQWRNLYRIVLVKPRAQVGQPLDHPGAPADAPQVGQPSDHPPPPAAAQVVQLTGAGGPTDAAQVVQSADSHIRSRPSGDPSEEPSGSLESAPRAGHRRHAFCPPDGKAGFCVPEFLHTELDTMLGAHAGDLDLLLWYVNTDKERRATQPTVLNGLDWWRDQLRAEIQGRGWASARRASDRPFTAKEIADADRVRFNARGCPHDGTCADRHACIAKIIRTGRGCAA